MSVNTGGTCTIEGCDKPMFGRTWCGMHYATWRRYGDPEYPVERRIRNSTCSEEDCDRPANRKGMCQMHRRREENHGEVTDPRERRFWAQVDRRGDDECWPWTGHVQPNGYGTFGTTGTRLVHRIAYQYMIGPIPKGLVLDHLCHTRDPRCEDCDECPHRRCANPSHLEPITPRENIARGRGGDSWGYVAAPVPRRAPEARPLVCTEADGGLPCSNPIYKRTICRKHYRRWLRDPSVDRTQKPVEERFWAKVDKRGPVSESEPDLGPCWLWAAVINRSTGYGSFYPKHGETVGAHRYAYELANGSIPDGYQVHHRCHTRACVRPDHLIATTRAANMAQRKNRRGNEPA